MTISPINLVRLTIGFDPEHPLVRELSLNVSQGETVALIGESGCGKSTLLRTIAGLHRPRDGCVRLLGKKPQDLFGSGNLQYMHQDPHVWEHLTVKDNVKLVLKLLKITIKDETITNLLNTVGLKTKDHEKYATQLSKGMKARLAIARVFATPVKILLVDEPFASLDQVRRNHLNEMLSDFGRTWGCATIWVTHDVAEAMRFASKLLVFPFGKPELSPISLHGYASVTDQNSLSPQHIELRDHIREVFAGPQWRGGYQPLAK